MHKTAQKGIQQSIPPHARYLSFRLQPGSSVRANREALGALLALVDGQRVVLGLGAQLCKRMRIAAPKVLKTFQPPKGGLVKIPTDQHDLWIWLRASASQDRGNLLSRTRQVQAALGPLYKLSQVVDAFKHADGHDLTDYEDGTENPKGRKAVSAALATDGSSFVAVQQWQHQWRKIEAMGEAKRNAAMGRERVSNKELEDAPESAHVKRTAQEEFVLSDGSPGFSWRRSMPWNDAKNSGLYFVSFGKNFEAFEAQLASMVGIPDGVTDAVFTMSKPLNTAYYWCPPLRGKHVQLPFTR
jgi:porphyrinogen peroxidase